MTRQHRLLLLPLALAACAPRSAPVLAPGGARPLAAAEAPAGAGRVNGDVGNPTALSPEQVAAGAGTVLNPIAIAETGADLTSGDVTLDFSDTDIRDICAQILGDTLKVTYTIDPSVRGTATFHGNRPIPRVKLVPILQTLLAQNNATLLQAGNVFRVAPAAAAGVPSFASGDTGAGGAVIPLRYASADELAKILQPIVGAGARLAADTGRNAIIITGEAQSRAALVDLVRSFDTDLLSGQSYALLPVPDGDAKDMATTLQDAFRSQAGGSLAGLVRVLPLSHANAVLLVTSNPRYLEAARRVFALIQRNERLTDRSWHVYYLQNSRADDIAYVLQRAFTPHDVTAQPDTGATNPAANNSSSGIGGQSFGGGSGGTSSGGLSGGVGGTSTSGTGGLGASGSNGISGLSLNGGTNTPPGGAAAAASSLVGSLDSGGDTGADTMRIIPNGQNNAILIYGTAQEYNTTEAMLQKIDLLPLQVRIDATIAEVTLNDQLQFGTQFFKEGSLNQTLSNSTTGSGFASGVPGFVFGATAGGVQATLSALQAVTTVHVLSSPELMVLDNQPASLQVGSQVPYLTGQSTTLTSSTPVTANTVSYQPTGVLLQVTPRVNSDGLVTMDVAQEVSSVDTTAVSSIGSPTFNDRQVKTRVVVQDGQTLGIAGLITDNISKGNQGIPFLKDIPIIGLLTGTQTNQRKRTELLVLITPHVVHDQRDALALTADLKNELLNAAAVPAESQNMSLSGAIDPSAKLRKWLGLQPGP